MDVLTVAAKANAASLLPAIAAVTCIQQTSPKSKLTVSYKDAETVGSQGAKLQLETAGKSITDEEILPYLREHYEVLQSGKTEEV